MAQITITINSREYAVACDNGQEAYTMSLARMLDEKAKMLTSGGAHINENMLLAMVGLLMADELTETKKKLTAGAPEPIIKTVEKPVEKYIEPDFSALDDELAKIVENLNAEIKTLANQVENL